MSYGFDATTRVVWFADLAAIGPRAGALCSRHAVTMALPRGWWLDDRRGDDGTLFVAPGDASADAEPPTRPRRARPIRGTEPPPPLLPLEATGPTTDPGALDGSAWTPSFDVTDDLDGLLAAKTPLLARAFGMPKPRRNSDQ